MSAPSPDLFLEAALAYQKTASIKAAIALDLFTAIAQEEGVLDRVAARVGAASRGVRILCDYLTVHGFLEKHDGNYSLSPSTALFLTTTSPAWMGSVIHFLCSPEFMDLFLDDPVAFVRNGGSPGLANIAPDNPIWVKFAKAMVPFIAPVAAALAEEAAHWPSPPRRVLDIAAGHGIFGISVAKAVPGSDITAIDWEAVLQVAVENARAAGVEGRYRTVAGSAFETDWGTEFDLILLTNFLHHFDHETCVNLLAKAKGSLRRGGRVVAVDLVPNPDRISPPFPAMFPFVMLGTTPRGDAYTAREYEEMGRAAGFETITISPVLPTPESFITFI
jgi:ubiquinone/menaquinone biosynthesis C-methylase UbiE